MKKVVSVLLALMVLLTMVSFASAEDDVAAIIEQAQGMTNEELYKKAIEESHDAVVAGVGNSSRGKSAGESFVEMLKTIDPTYAGSIDWQQPKNNSIFTMLESDINNTSHQFFMTLLCSQGVVRS